MEDDTNDEARTFLAENSMQFTLHPATNAYLDQLAATNIYGNTRVAVAVALIDEGIRKALKHGFIVK